MITSAFHIHVFGFKCPCVQHKNKKGKQSLTTNNLSTCFNNIIKSIIWFNTYKQCAIGKLVKSSSKIHREKCKRAYSIQVQKSRSCYYKIAVVSSTRHIDISIWISWVRVFNATFNNILVLSWQSFFISCNNHCRQRAPIVNVWSTSGIF